MRTFRFVAALALAASATSVHAAAIPADDPALRELLATSDLFAKAPSEFRAELDVRPLASTEEGNRLEVFRKGRDRELVRFLAEKERGKFLVRHGDDLFFLSPGSRRAVKLAPSYRVYGAAIDDLLGLDLARAYRIDAANEAGGVVTLELTATAPSAAAPKLRWVVARATKRPLRADLLSSSGKTLRVLEFKAWRDAAKGVPERLVVKDVTGGAKPLEVRFLAFEPTALDDALFDLEDGTARAALR